MGSTAPTSHDTFRCSLPAGRPPSCERAGRSDPPSPHISRSDEIQKLSSSTRGGGHHETQEGCGSEEGREGNDRYLTKVLPSGRLFAVRPCSSLLCIIYAPETQERNGLGAKGIWRTEGKKRWEDGRKEARQRTRRKQNKMKLLSALRCYSLLGAKGIDRPSQSLGFPAFPPATVPVDIRSRQ